MNYPLFRGATGAALLLAAMPGVVRAQAVPQPPATGPAAATPARIPAEKFAQLPFLDSPQLSPDGTRIAVQMAVNGKQRFAIIPVADTHKVALINPGDADLTGWRWVNNDWLIVTIGSTAPVEGDSWYLRRTLGVSADGKTINILGKNLAAQSADDVVWVASDGSPHVRIALQTSIYREDPGFWPQVRDFDVSTGKSTNRAAIGRQGVRLVCRSGRHDTLWPSL